MLKSRLLHPEILSALASAGHGSKIVIADSNYPFATHSGQNASLVFLNLAPGLVTATQALEVLAESIPIEAAEVMVPNEGPEPPIFQEFRAILGPSIELQTHSRFDFYDVAKSDDVCLTIASGEQRIYANVILTIGVCLGN
jgi:L-fucose mutarotase